MNQYNEKIDIAIKKSVDSEVVPESVNSHMILSMWNECESKKRKGITLKKLFGRKTFAGQEGLALCVLLVAVTSVCTIYAVVSTFFKSPKVSNSNYEDNVNVFVEESVIKQENTTQSASEVEWQEPMYISSRTKWQFTIGPLGYYYSDMKKYVHGGDYSYVHPYCFLDKATGEVSVLCANADCNHNDPLKCSAYFANIVMGNQHYSSGLEYYKGRLYGISYDKENGTRLMSYDGTGNDEVREMVIEANPSFFMAPWGEHSVSTIDKQFMIYDGKVYIWLSGSGEDDNTNVFKLLEGNLADKKIREVCSWNLSLDSVKDYDFAVRGTIRGMMGVDKGVPYFGRMLWAGDNTELEVFKMNDQGIETIWKERCYEKGKDKLSSNGIYLRDNKIYYHRTSSDGAKGQLCIYDLTTKDTSIIPVDDMAMWDMCYSIDDTYIYLWYQMSNGGKLLVYNKNDLNVMYEYTSERYDSSIVLIDEDRILINDDNNMYLDKSTIGTGNEKWVEIK